MKRAISAMLSLALMLSLLPACQAPAGETDPPVQETEEMKTARELADLVLPYSGCDEGQSVEYLDADLLEGFIEAACELTREQWEDAAVIRRTGASAFELFILRLGDEDAAARMETVLADHRTARQGDFTGYAPAEAEMAANGRIRREGRTLGLFICPDADGAEAAFAAACKGEELPPLPEPDVFEPPFAIHDLLHRLLLEAACPEWRGGRMDAAWVTGDNGRSVTACWGDGYYVSGAMNAAMNNESVEDGLRPLNSYQVTVYLTDSEDAAKQVAEKWNGVLKEEAEA